MFRKSIPSFFVVLLIVCIFLGGASVKAESQLRTVNLAKAAWKGDPSIPEELKSSDISFVVFTLQTIHGEDMVFLDQAGKQFMLKADGHPDIRLDVNGGFSARGGLSGFVFHLQNEESMALGVPYTIVPPEDNGSGYNWVGGDVSITRTAVGTQPTPPSGGGQNSETPVTLDRIEASERELVMTAGQATRIKIYAIQSNGKEKEITNDKKTVYRTDSASVANVAAGTIKAGKMEGKAVITVSYEGKKTTIGVKVSQNTVTKLQASVKDLTLRADESQDVRLTATFSDNTVKDVSSLAIWTTDNSQVADVEIGEVIGVDVGEAVITASYNGLRTEVRVEVIPAYFDEESLMEAVGLEASNRNIKMKVNQDKVLQIYAVYEDGSKEEVTEDVLWQTSKSDVVDVNEGVFTAEAPGKATITVNYRSLSLKISVEVEKSKPLKSLTASQKKIVLKRGEEKEVRLTAVFMDGKREEVAEDAVWSVKNEEIAFAEAGVIVADKRGTTIVTASYNGKKVNIVVQVK